MKNNIYVLKLAYGHFCRGVDEILYGLCMVFHARRLMYKLTARMIQWDKWNMSILDLWGKELGVEFEEEGS